MVEVDDLAWTNTWQLVPPGVFDTRHRALIDGETWLAVGLGRWHSIPPRLARATHIIHCDLPLWQHVWLFMDRREARSRSTRRSTAQPPAPLKQTTREMFRIESELTPALRAMVGQAERDGKFVRRVRRYEELADFVWAPAAT